MKRPGPRRPIKLDGEPALQFWVHGADPAEMNLRALLLTQPPNLKEQIETLAHVGIAGTKNKGFIRGDAELLPHSSGGAHVGLQRLVQPLWQDDRLAQRRRTEGLERAVFDEA